MLALLHLRPRPKKDPWFRLSDEVRWALNLSRIIAIRRSIEALRDLGGIKRQAVWPIVNHILLQTKEDWE